MYENLKGWIGLQPVLFGMFEGQYLKTTPKAARTLQAKITTCSQGFNWMLIERRPQIPADTVAFQKFHP